MVIIGENVVDGRRMGMRLYRTNAARAAAISTFRRHGADNFTKFRDVNKTHHFGLSYSWPRPKKEN